MKLKLRLRFNFGVTAKGGGGWWLVPSAGSPGSRKQTEHGRTGSPFRVVYGVCMRQHPPSGSINNVTPLAASVRLKFRRGRAYIVLGGGFAKPPFLPRWSAVGSLRESIPSFARRLCGPDLRLPYGLLWTSPNLSTSSPCRLNCGGLVGSESGRSGTL